MSLTRNKMMAAGGGAAVVGCPITYPIDNSILIKGTTSGSDGYLSRSPSQNGDRKTWTFSAWLKRDQLDKYQHVFNAGLNTQSYETLLWYPNSLTSGAFHYQYYISNSKTGYATSEMLFRDPAAWYHIVFVRDSTQSTAADRIRLYVNGVRQDFISSSTYGYQAMGQNDEGYLNSTSYVNYVGSAVYVQANGDGIGYIAETNFVDGQGLTADDFGVIDTCSGQWVAKEYTGTYGTNGFYLDFSGATVGTDNSGNSNDFTAVNLTSADVRPDTPTNNYCTMNPLSVSDYVKWTFSEGNLKGVNSGDGSGEATFELSSGKWYFEVDHTDAGGKNGLVVALFGLNDDYIAGSFDVRLIDGSGTGLYGVSIDMDAGSFATTLNGSASSSGSFTPQDCKIAFVNGTSAFAKTFIANFGQDSSFAGARTAQGNGGDGEDFYYTPPTGYKALCTKNLPEPEINKPTDHFNTVLYTANQSTNAITGVEFQPDFTWIKNRTQGQNHALFDSVRGVNKQLRSDTTDAELTSWSDLLTSFDTDGFTLGADASVGDVNRLTGNNMVSWNWKAGGAAVSNTEGTIASSVSANPDAGFSIATYTGNGQTLQTVGHGLSEAPEMYIVKRRDTADSWIMWNHNYPTNNYQVLDGTNGLNDGTGVTWSTEPTSTVFGIDNDNSVNKNATSTYLAYCWHSVPGYSRVGVYDGISQEDGKFVFTGFRPAFIFIKRISAGGSNSYIVDCKRVGYNNFVYATDVGANKYLWPDSSTSESAGNSTKGIGMDILSNGFKFRTIGNDYNGGSQTYIFFAVAESPFKYSNAR